MEALTCNVCLERYDTDVRRPKALKCGHSLCLTCLTTWLEIQVKLVCPTCQKVSWEKLEEIPDNQSMKDILMGYEMRCPRHSAVEVSAYCVGHMEIVCENCGHTGTEAGCTLKYLIEDEQEIKIKVIQEVERRSKDLPEAMAPVIRQAIDKRFKNKIGENIQLLEKIKDLEKSEQVLLCTACQNVADNFIEIATFEAYCSHCETYNPDNTNSVQIGRRSNEEIAQLLASKVPALLKKVNFCHLSLDHLIRIEKRASLTPKEAQQLGKDLLALEGPKPDFSALPDTFLCSGCKTPQYKSTCNMFILPCTKLHALCEACVGQAGTMSMTCPLDLMTYKRKPEELLRLAASVSPQRATLSASSQMARSRTSLGIALPEPRVDPGLQYVVRFPRVLPVPGFTFTNNKGWLCDFTRNQVEAVTITALISYRLMTVGIANPINPGDVAVVESLSLYEGKAATGNPIAVHQGYELLQGGDQVLTYVTLSSPFNIPASPVTLKIKLVPLPSNPPITDFELYRGNPYTRPEVWVGTDGLIWNFEETTVVDSNETMNRQKNLSGPILALIYKH